MSDVRERTIPNSIRNKLEKTASAKSSSPSASSAMLIEEAMNANINEEELINLIKNNSPNSISQPEIPKAVSKEVPKEVIKNINNDSGMAVAPPPITPDQIRARLLRNKDEDSIDTDKVLQSPAAPRLIINPILPESSDYIRVELFSGFIFYDKDELLLSKIDISQHLKIIKAQRTRDISLLIDAIGATFYPGGLDVRDLTLPDFYHVLYWHRFNSYPHTPFNVTWESKYGNKNVYKIQSSNVKYNPPKTTKEEVKKWQDAGFDIPRVRDLEVWDREEFTEEEQDLIVRAQWFKSYPYDKPPSLQGKIDGMQEVCGVDLGAIEYLKEFKDLVNHSIDEFIDVVDSQFDCNKYLEGRRLQLAEVSNKAKEIEDSNPILFASYSDEMDVLAQEISLLEAQLNVGGKVLADIERVGLNLSVFDFFPNI